MGKPAAYLFAILVGAIIWFFFQNFHVDGWNNVRVVPKTREAQTAATGDTAGNRLEQGARKLMGGLLQGASSVSKDAGLKGLPQTRPGTIRIASLHLTYLGAASGENQEVMEVLAQLIRKFDIVALQGVAVNAGSTMGRLIDLINGANRKYDFIAGAPGTLRHLDTQFIFLYDRETIITDREELYTLGDPDNLLLREPLVGWFRARQADANEAFTFTLVNVDTDSARTMQELNVLDDVLFEVREDGRGEDDVILLGSFHANDRSLGELGRISQVQVAVQGIPTHIDDRSQTENIIFQYPATDEFTGQAGVINLGREWQLTATLEQEVSEFRPVWAEFSIYEGGRRSETADNEVADRSRRGF